MRASCSDTGLEIFTVVLKDGTDPKQAAHIAKYRFLNGLKIMVKGL